MADNRTYNARVTTEALEKKFRDTFPSQAGAELVDDLYASGVIVPVVDFSQAAEGSVLRADLQTARDFAQGNASINTTSSQSIVSTPGFWQIDINYVGFVTSTAVGNNTLFIQDSSGVNKIVWLLNNSTSATGSNESFTENEFVVYLRAGDDLRGSVYNVAARLNIVYRQIADVNGNLVNPLGFTSS